MTITQYPPQSATILGLSPAGFHHMHYLDWGSKHQENIVFCAHGLSRNGRDFDFLAHDLAKNFRVICPDLAGRGKSDWLSNPLHYNYPQYLSDIAALIARSHAEKIHWIGTSMGGIMGMFLAIQPNSPIKSLVMNDIGAFIPSSPLVRIANYVKNSPIFSSFEQGEKHLRQILAPFGKLSAKQWAHIAYHGLEPVADGFRLAYDPKISETLDTQDADLWHFWSLINCPVLLIRGENSDIFSRETAAKMKELKPHITLVEIPETGHAPALMSPHEIDIIHQWLLQHP